MPAIHLDHVSFRHTSAVDLLVDMSAHLGPGWTGLVGANGSGKSTLLRLINGDLSPGEGRVVLDPADALVVSCDQEVESCSPAIDHLAAAWDGPAIALRGRMRLDPADLVRWDTLSPGERKRWQIAGALAADPDMLLLDEPTNHLDADGRDLLIAALDGFAGVGIIVSHDRTLLERLTVRTLRLAHRGATLWSGAYASASEAWTAGEEAIVQRYAGLRREQRKVERRIADQRRAMEAKQARFRRVQRTSSIKDIDARSAARGWFHAEGEKAAFSELAASVRARDRIAAETAAVAITKERGGDLYVDYEPCPKRTVLAHRGPLRAGGRLLSPHVDVTLDRGERVWLGGPNGAGKTTLLATLLEGSSLPPERVLGLPQELSRREAQATLGRIRALPPGERGRVMSIAAALGADPDLLLASDLPSPGEARKLVIADGLGRRAWVVILDEPTNHLDLPSIERLEVALSGYPGAMIIVTHDTAFAAALDLAEWRLEGPVVAT